MEIIEAAKIGAACLVAIAATGASLKTANNYYGFKNRYHRAAADYETFVPVAIAAWSALVMFL